MSASPCPRPELRLISMRVPTFVIGHLLRRFGRKRDRAGSRSRTGGRTAAERLEIVGLRQANRIDTVEVVFAKPLEGRALVDQAFGDEIAGDAQGGQGRALGVAGCD